MADKKTYTKQATIDVNGNFIARGNIYFGNTIGNNYNLVKSFKWISRTNDQITGTLFDGTSSTLFEIDDKVDKGGLYGGSVHYPVFTGVKILNAADASNTMVSLDPLTMESIGGILHSQTDRHFTFREYTAGASYHEDYFLPVPTADTTNPNYYILTTKTVYVGTTSGTRDTSNSASGSCDIAKWGNIVTVSFSFKANGNSKKTNTLFTIPSGYRPKVGMRFACTDYAGTNAVNMWISTDGVLKENPSNSSEEITNGHTYGGSCTYVCA